MKKVILDACCGGKMFHTDKSNPLVLFMDIRHESPQKLSNGATFSVSPDIIGDFTKMPFASNTFYMVVFDPPHLRCGEKSFMFKKYGTLTAKWKDTIRSGFEECFRVLRPYGTLVFKWSDSFKKLPEILKLSPCAPIIVHSATSKSGQKRTHFAVFMKQEEARNAFH